MRLFVAVTPPEAVLDEVGAAVAPYARWSSDVRWIPKERQHLTLSFLGDVDDDRVERLSPRLDRVAADRSPLELQVAGSGAFPRTSRARVLWLGLSGDRDLLVELATAVSAAARHSDIEQEKRKFSPHLTLARCREPADLRPLVDALSTFASSSWTAADVHLVRSHLGPKPWYETVSSWPLSGASRG